jgi:hypothetical protein
MLIGRGVLRTKRALQGLASTLDQVLDPGSARSKDQWH